MRELCPAAGGHWRWFPVDALARSILFLAATAEEKGLLGSDYLAYFPTVPIKSIVADINMDGVSVLYTFNDIIARGAPDNSLDAVVARNAPPGIESNS